MTYYKKILFAVLILSGVLFVQSELLRTAQAEDESYRNLELFTDVLAIIQKSYVEDVDTKDLIYGGIRGMLETLDPHSSFLSPDMYQEMKVDTHGEFGGLGIEIALREGRLTVVAPIEGTPAYKAGIKAGDLIHSIDGEPVKDMEMMDAIRRLRGPKGEPVKLTIWREGFESPTTFTIVRDIIQIHSVKTRELEPAVAYVKISQFQEKTGADLRKQIAELKEERGEPLKGLVLDLRNNPGGLLDQAVSVADLFLKEGLIVYTEGREPGSKMDFRATSAGTEPDYPIVVLINEGSASASEIVAGALSDHGRAVILGERSFGKGSVQTILPLSDNSGLRLTTARYFTPNGTSIQAKGIVPDIIVPSMELNQDETSNHYRERDLDNHIDSDNEVPASEQRATPLSQDDRRDFQLMRALDLIKGLEIFKSMKPTA